MDKGINPDFMLSLIAAAHSLTVGCCIKFQCDKISFSILRYHHQVY